MKKFTFFLLLLLGCSAFALNPTCLKCGKKIPCKMAQQKVHKPSPTPLADMLLFPSITG